MNKNFTLKSDNVIVEKKMNPKKETISFLEKFARTYYAEPKLSQKFNGTILN